MPVAGSHGFAVGKERVLMVGGYNQGDSLFLGRLDTLEFEELTAADREGQPLQKFRAFGRRDHLFLATDESLHVVNLSRL